MDELKDRIKKIRNSSSYGKTQDSFAEYLGISKSNLASYESGRRNPSDAVIQLFCEKCNISEEWLRDGIGYPYSQSIPDYLKNIPKEDRDFIKELISVYKNLDQDSKDALKLLAGKMLNKNKEHTNTVISLEEKESDDNFEPKAAHDRADVNHTTEGKSNDDTIMDNNDEWK